MKEFRATKSFTKFYLAIFFRVLFLLVMALLTGALHGKALSKFGEVVMILMSFSLLLASFYTVIVFYRNAPGIRINTSCISVGSKTYYWSNLEQVAFTGKKRFKHSFFGDDREILMLKFVGYDALYLFDDVYSNAAQIKTFIYDEVVGHPLQAALTSANSDKTRSSAHINYISESFINYRGYLLLSFEGVFQWVIIILCLYVGIMAFIENKKGFSIFMFCNILFYLALFMGRMYYFKMSENYFVVKNSTKFWVNDVYLFSDVREIVFERHTKMPVALRIITNDFESKLYPAVSLWDKRWRELRDDLKSKGITIRMECSIG